MRNNRGDLACAGAANLFWVGGLCAVHARAPLRGAGRHGPRALIDRLPVREVRAGPEGLQGVDAIFLTNALIGVAPVVDLDGYRLRRIRASLSFRPWSPIWSRRWRRRRVGPWTAPPSPPASRPGPAAGRAVGGEG